MKSAPFKYQRATTLAHAVECADNDHSLFIAGGQSLLPMLALRLARTEDLIDIKELADLNVIEDLITEIRIGAGTTHAAIEDGDVPDEGAGLLRDIAGDIAYRAIRNRGTIGGSIALADPAADWPLCLIALSARAVIVNAQGSRTIAVDDLIRGAYETVLGENDLISCFIVPKLPAQAKVGRCKLTKKKGAFALSHAITILGAGDDRIFISGVTDRPVYLPQTSDMLSKTDDDGVLSDVLAADLKNYIDATTYEFRMHHAVASDSIKRAFST